MTLSVLVPSSLARTDAKRAATRKLGYVARAATVFRADRLVVFPDPEGEGKWGGGFVETVLRYAATPPYLRREVWDERDELEYAGVLPPLRAGTRTGSGPKRSGSLRQGLVTEVGPDGRVRVNCGLQHPVSLVAPPNREVGVGERVTVRISSRRPVRAALADRPLPGLSVERADLSAALDRPEAGLRVATSRHGWPVDADGATRLARARTAAGGDLTVAFGAPERGLPAMVGIDPDAVPDEWDGVGADTTADATAGGSAPGGFDLWLNAVPDQGSEVVRTEEATFAALAVLSLE